MRGPEGRGASGSAGPVRARKQQPERKRERRNERREHERDKGADILDSAGREDAFKPTDAGSVTDKIITHI